MNIDILNDTFNLIIILSALLYFISTIISPKILWTFLPFSAFLSFKDFAFLDFRKHYFVYSLVHKTVSGRVSHYLILIDLFAWIFLIVKTKYFIPLTILLLFFHFRSIGIKRFEYFYLFILLIFCITSYLMSLDLIYIKLYIMFSGLVKFIGHLFEDVPPFLFGKNIFSTGNKYRISNFPNVLLMSFLGFLAEFTAGMPFRLASVLNFRIFAKLAFVSNEYRIAVSEIDNLSETLKKS